jgi:hypothetical protein
MFHKRVVQQPLIQAFDGLDAQASRGRRENTTVAPQALALLNDKFVRARSMDFAQRVEKEAGAETEAQVHFAWRLALGREATTEELKSGTAFITAQLQQRSAHEPDKAKGDVAGGGKWNRFGSCRVHASATGLGGFQLYRGYSSRHISLPFQKIHQWSQRGGAERRGLHQNRRPQRRDQQDHQTDADRSIRRSRYNWPINLRYPCSARS